MILALSGKIGSGKDLVGKIIQYLTSYGDSKGKTFNPNEDYTIGSDWEVHKFGGKLKDIICILTGCTREDLESQEFKAKQLGEEWNWFRGLETDSEGAIVKTRLNPTEEAKKMLPFPERIKPYTYREMLQRVGTEAMRNQIHENVWINALFSEYKEQYSQGGIGNFHDPINYRKSLGYPSWIITDARFPNEAKAIKDRNGLMIRVNRKEFITTERPDGIKITEIKGAFAHIMKLEHPSETGLDDYKDWDYVIDNSGTIEELVEKVKDILIKQGII